MNPVATRLNEASVVMEDTPHPELVAMLRIGAEEIQRLQGLVDKGIESVWTGRRFIFSVLKQPANTPLAIVFNDILTQLGQDTCGVEAKAMHERFYPQPPENSAPLAGAKP